MRISRRFRPPVTSSGPRLQYFQYHHCARNKGRYGPLYLPLILLGKGRLYQDNSGQFRTPQEQGIDFHELPRTFQDVVQVTRVLGVRYLWIDSLCIIQDDVDDWKVESGRIADIYRHSYLTVAATWADSANGGCFSAPEQETVGPVMVRKLTHILDSISQRSIASKPRPRDDFPLLSRAWAYQERMLSPPVLHFGRQEMSWECFEGRKCECGSPTIWNPDTEVPKSVFHDTISKFHSRPRRLPQQTWRQMVVEYSSLQLTYSSDKLPAFSGLANEFQRQSKQEYLAESRLR